MPFVQAVEFVIAHEGGYVNDPSDLGGETKFGISKRSYPKLDIKHLTVDQAMDIYRRDYWERARGGELPDKVAIVVMDTAVNSGVATASKLLQESVNTFLNCPLKVDGILGPKTLEAVHAVSPELLARELLLRRLEHYRGIIQVRHANARFLSGWINRVLDLYGVVGGN